MREIVLDAETGLPEVRASRSDDGQITFRVHEVNPGGGMSVFRPISDAVLQTMRSEHAIAEDWAGRLAQVQLAYAQSLRTAGEQREAKLHDLEAQNQALDEQVAAERERAQTAERELQELKAKQDRAAQEHARKSVAPKRAAA